GAVDNSEYPLVCASDFIIPSKFSPAPLSNRKRPSSAGVIQISANPISASVLRKTGCSRIGSSSMLCWPTTTARRCWHFGGIQRNARGWSSVSEDFTESTGADHCHSALSATVAIRSSTMVAKADIFIFNRASNKCTKIIRLERFIRKQQRRPRSLRQGGGLCHDRRGRAELGSVPAGQRVEIQRIDGAVIVEIAGAPDLAGHSKMRRERGEVGGVDHAVAVRIAGEIRKRKHVVRVQRLPGSSRNRVGTEGGAIRPKFGRGRREEERRAICRRVPLHRLDCRHRAAIDV